ncbi:hypothetical protein Tco_1392536 [Tanacetum coccineum]
MWKLKVAQGNDPYLFSTNNFVGRQILEFDPDVGTLSERHAVEDARQQFKRKVHLCSDLLMRMQRAYFTDGGRGGDKYGEGVGG